MSKAIIYFTRKQRLCNVLGVDEIKLYPFLKENEVEQIIYSAETSKVILVNDQLDLKKFKIKVWPKINFLFTEFAFVYHKSPDDSLIEFLHTQTKLSKKGSHDEDTDGYSFYEYLINIIEQETISETTFTEIWEQFEEAADSEDELNQAYETWLASIPYSETSLSEKKVIYIDNVSAQFKEKINSYGIKVMSPLEIMNHSLDNETRLIVLCEVSINMDGNPVKRTDFYGIQLVQQLRRKRYKGGVLFISHWNRKQITEESNNHLIINTIGHLFTKYSSNPLFWIHLIERREPLSNLALDDIIQSYCSRSNIVRSILHDIISNPNDIKELEIKIKDSIEGISKLYDVSHLSSLSNFTKTFSPLSKENKANAVQFVQSFAKQIVLENPDEFSQTSSDLKAKYEWSLLFLDDEINEDDPLVTELKDRNIKVELAHTVEEAKEKWNTHSRYDQKIMVVLADYRLKEKLEGVEVHQDKQGYEFLKMISDGGYLVKLIALSSMTRKFLMESFKSYGVEISILSKTDFPLDSEQGRQYICDEVVSLGDKNWITLSNLPNTPGWRYLKSSYIQIKNHKNYENIEKLISVKANDWVDKHNRGQNKLPLRISQTKYSPKRKEKNSFLNNNDLDSIFRKFKKYIKADTNALSQSEIDRLNKFDKAIPKAIDKYLSLFRDITDDYFFSDELDIENSRLLSEENINKSLEFFIARRIAIWLSQKTNLKGGGLVSQITGESETTLSKSNKYQQYLNALGLQLSDYPNGLTIEEQNWLTYSQGFTGLKKDLDIYNDLIEKISLDICSFINENPKIESFFDTNKIEYLFNNERIEVFILENKKPLIRSFLEIRAVLNHINNQLSKNISNLEAFYLLRKKIRVTLSNINSVAASKLNTFLRQLKNPSTNVERRREYIEIVKPWQQITLNKGRGVSKKEVATIINNILSENIPFFDDHYPNLEKILYYAFLDFKEQLKEVNPKNEDANLNAIIHEVALIFNKRKRELRSPTYNISIQETSSEGEIQSKEDVIDKLYYQNNKNEEDRLSEIIGFNSSFIFSASLKDEFDLSEREAIIKYFRFYFEQNNIKADEDDALWFMTVWEVSQAEIVKENKYVLGGFDIVLLSKGNSYSVQFSQLKELEREHRIGNISVVFFPFLQTHISV